MTATDKCYTYSYKIICDEILKAHKGTISRRMRRSGHVAYMGARRNAYKFWQENINRRNSLGGLEVGREIILKCITDKSVVRT